MCIKKSKKALTKTVAMLLIAIIVFSVLPLTTLAAPDNGYVLYTGDSNDEAGYQRLQYIQGSINTPYYYSAVTNFNSTYTPYYYIGGIGIDTPFATPASRSSFTALQSSSYGVPFKGYINNVTLRTDPYNTAGGGLIGSTNLSNYCTVTGSGTFNVTFPSLTEQERIFRGAVREIMFNGYPFSAKGLSAGNGFGISWSACTWDEAMIATNIALQRLGTMFATGNDSGSIAPFDSGGVTRDNVAKYTWYLETLAHLYIATEAASTGMIITPQRSDMTYNATENVYERSVNISIPSIQPTSGYNGKFTVHNVDFPTGTKMYLNGSTTPFEFGTLQTLKADFTATVRFTVPATSANADKLFGFNGTLQTVFNDYKIGVFHNGGIAEGFAIVADPQEFPDPDPSAYRDSTPTYAYMRTPNTGTLIVHKIGEGDDSAGLAGAVIGLYENNGSLIDQKTTNERGNVTFGPIAPGNYKVREIAVPNASTNPIYDLNDTMYSVTVNGGTTAEITIANTKTRITIQAVTKGEANNMLGNCIVSLYESDGTTLIEEKQTDTNGKAVFAPVLLGNYIVKETYVPNPYVLGESGTQAETVRNITGVYGVSHYSVEIKNAIAKGTITIDRQDIETGVNPQGDATLNGARYDVYNSANVKVATLTTLPNERTITSGLLPLDTYKIVETGTPTGYLPPSNPATTATLTYKDMYTPQVSSSATVMSEVIRGIVSISKFASIDPTGLLPEGHKYPLENVVFTATLKSKNELSDTITTDVEGKAQTRRLAYGTYTITETQGVEGFDLVPPYDVFISQNGKIYFSYIEDATVQREISIVKKDDGTGNVIAMAGTKFQVLNSAKEVVTFDVLHPQPTTLTEFETDSSGSVYLPNKLIAGTYYLRELQAPNGYLLNTEDIPFEVTDSSPQTIVVEIKDVNAMGIINIEKTGEVFEGMQGGLPVYSQQPLADVVFEVIASDNIITNDGTLRASMGDVVDTLTTDAEGKTVSKQLYLGSYIVREKQVPKDYVLDKTEHTAILEYADQNTPIVQADITVQNALRKLNITFTKTAELMNNDELSFNYVEKKGIEFGLYANASILNAESRVILAKDDLISTAISDENGNVNFKGIPNVDCYIMETNTNKNYIPNATKYIVAKSETNPEDTEVFGTINKGRAVKNHLVKKALEILNHEKDKEEIVIPKGEFDVIFQNKVVAQGVTDEYGKIYITQVPLGNYVIKQTKAHDDYLLNEQAFEISITNTQDDFVVKVPNEKRKPEIMVTKFADKSHAMWGETVTWDVKVKNKGTLKAIDVVVNDNRFRGIKPFDENGNYYIDVLNAGEEILLTFREKVVDDAGTTIKNVVVVNSKLPNGTPLEEKQAEAEYIVIPMLRPDIVVTKAVDKEQAMLGDNVTWTIIVENKGSGTAKDVVVKDERLKGFAPFDENGLFAVGEMKSGAKKEITVSEKVVAEVDTVVKNVVVVSSKTPDNKPLPDEKAEDEYKVVPALQPKISVAKSVDKQLAKPGDSVTWTITVMNTGDGTAQAVTVKDERLKGVSPFDANGIYIIDELKKGEKKIISASETVTDNIGSVVKNVVIVTVGDTPEIKAEAQYTVVSKDSNTTTNTAQNNSGKNGGGAQTGQDGLPVWALIVLIGFATAGIVTVIILKKKEKKQEGR